LKRNLITEGTEAGLAEEVAITTSDDREDSAFARLGASLAEIRKLEGVIGYILRGNASAMLDLADLDKISEYAALAYQLNESTSEIAEQLGVAEVRSVLVEGGNLKVLFIRMGENKISVFMEKSASHSEIIKQILNQET